MALLAGNDSPIFILFVSSYLFIICHEFSRLLSETDTLLLRVKPRLLMTFGSRKLRLQIHHHYYVFKRYAVEFLNHLSAIKLFLRGGSYFDRDVFVHR